MERRQGKGKKKENMIEEKNSTGQDEFGSKKGPDQHQLLIVETLAVGFVIMRFIRTADLAIKPNRIDLMKSVCVGQVLGVGSGHALKRQKCLVVWKDSTKRLLLN